MTAGVTERIAFGGGDFDELRFRRVMAGEYRAQVANGWTYTIDRRWSGCDQCPHSHDGWFAEFHPAYQVREEIGQFRTLTDARIAAAEHAIKEGFIKAAA